MIVDYYNEVCFIDYIHIELFTYRLYTYSKVHITVIWFLAVMPLSKALTPQLLKNSFPFAAKGICYMLEM